MYVCATIAPRQDVIMESRIGGALYCCYLPQEASVGEQVSCLLP